MTLLDVGRFSGFEPTTFGNLATLDGWSGPVPPLSDMGQTGLTVAQPSRQQDTEKDLRTVQAGLEELQI